MRGDRQGRRGRRPSVVTRGIRCQATASASSRRYGCHQQRATAAAILMVGTKGSGGGRGGGQAPSPRGGRVAAAVERLVAHRHGAWLWCSRRACLSERVASTASAPVGHVGWRAPREERCAHVPTTVNSPCGLDPLDGTIGHPDTVERGWVGILGVGLGEVAPHRTRAQPIAGHGSVRPPPGVYAARGRRDCHRAVGRACRWGGVPGGKGVHPTGAPPPGALPPRSLCP